MTDADTVDKSFVSIPSRHRQLWEERDFGDVMEACLEGCDLDAVAQRVGRTVGGLRGQIRRLLPVDERRLRVDLVPARLRELASDGDYDWRHALTLPPPSAWRDLLDVTPTPTPAPSSGVAGLPDEHLVSLAASLAVSHLAVHPELQRKIAEEVWRRQLLEWVGARAHDGLDHALVDLLSIVRDEPSRPFDARYAARRHLSVLPDQPSTWDEPPDAGPTHPW